jgi:hypothetical protein
LLLNLTKDGALALDDGDELHAGVVITRDGAVVHPALAPKDAGQAGSAENESSESDDASASGQAAGSAEGIARVSGPAS